MKPSKQLRRAAIAREQFRRYHRHLPISLRTCLFSHLAWVQGHRQLYMSGQQALDVAFCWEMLGWASQCNRLLKEAAQPCSLSFSHQGQGRAKKVCLLSCPPTPPSSHQSLP